MSAQRPSKATRIAALAAVFGIVLLVAGYFSSGYHPKTLGVLLAAAAAVFFLGETFFWKAIEKLTELPLSETLNAAEANDLAQQVNALKSRLTERWIILLVLKAVAGVCAAWLLNQQNPNGHQKIVWLVGVGALTISLPMALTFLRNWQQADEIKTQQLLRAKQRAELKAATEELEKSPSSPLNADKMLADYTKIVHGPKPKGNSH